MVWVSVFNHVHSSSLATDPEEASNQERNGCSFRVAMKISRAQGYRVEQPAKGAV